MGFLKGFLFSILVFVAFTNCAKVERSVDTRSEINSRGIYKGFEATEKENEKYGSILGLAMNDSGICSSVNLGDGLILTAYHCLHLGDNEKPKLQVVSYETKTIFDLGTNYTMEVPPADEEIEIEGGKVPQPDLTMIVLSGDAKEAISKLRRAYLPTKSLKVGETDVQLAGYGRDNLGNNAKVGTLRQGLAKVAEVTSLFYVLKWTDVTEGFLGLFGAGKDKNAAALPGDSGGPLFKLTPKGLVVYGIASIFYANKEVTEGGNYYVRLDGATASEWLSKFVK